jgi:hypothetical protein
MKSSVSHFLPAPDSVDPARGPQRKLASGVSMPAVGLGTFGSDHVTAQTVADAVSGEDIRDWIDSEGRTRLARCCVSGK